MMVSCGTCGVEFDKRPDRVAKHERHFCSRTCYDLAKSGDGNPNWNGGRRKHEKGYIMLYRPDHPNATRKGYVMEHRLVAEEKIGRLLDPEEVVHHLNGVKDDNRPENVQVLAGQGAHSEIHLETYTRDELGRFA